MADESVVYDVVPYSDVRGVAQDAANEALETYQTLSDAQVEQVAQDSAEAALDGAESKLLQAQDAAIGDAADASANKALEGVQEALDAQLQAIEDRSAVVEATPVVLDDEQWEFAANSMQVVATTTTLNLVMTCAVFGAHVASFFVKGWRR